MLSSSDEEVSYDTDTVKYNVYDHLQKNTPEHNKNLSKKSSLNFAVCLINIKGDKNTGMMIRTSAIMGADKVIIMGKRQYDRRTSVGSHHYIDVECHSGIVEPSLLFENYSPICVEQGGQYIDDIQWKSNRLLIEKPPCFVMGSEDEGIPYWFLEKCKPLDGFKHVSIYQHGIIRSMNVATAHSIVLYEYTKSVRKRISDKY